MDAWGSGEGANCRKGSYIGCHIWVHVDFISAVLQWLLINIHLSFNVRLIYSLRDYINGLGACYKWMLMVVLFPLVVVVLRGNISQNASQMEVSDGVNVWGTSILTKHCITISFSYLFFLPTHYSFLQLIFHYQVTDCSGAKVPGHFVRTEQPILQ